MMMKGERNKHNSDGRTQLGRGQLTNHKHVSNRCHVQDKFTTFGFI